MDFVGALTRNVRPGTVLSVYIVLPSAGALRLAKKQSVNLTVMMISLLLGASRYSLGTQNWSAMARGAKIAHEFGRAPKPYKPQGLAHHLKNAKRLRETLRSRYSDLTTATRAPRASAGSQPTPAPARGGRRLARARGRRSGGRKTAVLRHPRVSSGLKA